jgi:hypothetical protein
VIFLLTGLFLVALTTGYMVWARRRSQRGISAGVGVALFGGAAVLAGIIGIVFLVIGFIAMR